MYALCASGALYYIDARENKNPSKEAQKDRTAKYTRSAEYFDKALQISPQCAFAAQGLAIGLAEGALGNGPLDAAAAATTTAGANGSAAAPLTEQQARLRNARDALSILTRVKESLNEASVYINIGHCHFARDEYDRAIENVSFRSFVFPLPASETTPGLTAVRADAVLDGVEAVPPGQELDRAVVPLEGVLPQGRPGAELCRLAPRDRDRPDGEAFPSLSSYCLYCHCTC